MSIFNRRKKSSSKTKTPSIKTSRFISENSPYTWSIRRKRTTSHDSANSSLADSSEDLPVLTPSPYGSLRDIEVSAGSEGTYPTHPTLTASRTGSGNNFSSHSPPHSQSSLLYQRPETNSKLGNDNSASLDSVKQRDLGLVNNTIGSGSSSLPALNIVHISPSSSPPSDCVVATDEGKITPIRTVQHFSAVPLAAAISSDTECVVEQEDIVYTSVCKKGAGPAIPLNHQSISSPSVSPQIFKYSSKLDNSLGTQKPSISRSSDTGVSVDNYIEEEITTSGLQESIISNSLCSSTEEEFITPDTTFTQEQINPEYSSQLEKGIPIVVEQVQVTPDVSSIEEQIAPNLISQEHTTPNTSIDFNSGSATEEQITAESVSTLQESTTSSGATSSLESSQYIEKQSADVSEAHVTSPEEEGFPLNSRTTPSLSNQVEIIFSKVDYSREDNQHSSEISQAVTGVSSSILPADSNTVARLLQTDISSVTQSTILTTVEEDKRSLGSSLRIETALDKMSDSRLEVTDATSTAAPSAGASSTGAPLIQTTPSSEVNLANLARILESKEYRLPTESETDDAEHLSPHTPIADHINTSFPDSDSEVLTPASTKQEVSFLAGVRQCVSNHLPEITVLGLAAVGGLAVGLIAVRYRTW